MELEYGSGELEYLSARDAALSRVIARLGHLRRQVDDDLFASVVRHIIGQQISMRAQQTVWERLEAALGAVTPQALAPASRAQLQGLGMSWRKADYILEFTQQVATGGLDLSAVARLDDAGALTALTALRGIGVWTAEMILLFGLHRRDILSFGDLAIQRGMRMVYRRRVITREEFERHRRRLSPCGSIASLYYWAVAGGALPELDDPAPRAGPAARRRRS